MVIQHGDRNSGIVTMPSSVFGADMQELPQKAGRVSGLVPIPIIHRPHVKDDGVLVADDLVKDSNRYPVAEPKRIFKFRLRHISHGGDQSRKRMSLTVVSSNDLNEAIKESL